MGESAALPTQAPGKPINERHTRFPISRWLLLSTIVIFAIETALMVLLEFVLNLYEPIVWVIDGLILGAVLFPLNYRYIVRPMIRQIEEHDRAIQELTRSNQMLERFFSISDILVAYMDADFNFIRVNQPYADTDEQEPSFYVGKNHFDMFPNDENRAIFETVVKTGKTFHAYEKPFEYEGHPERGVSYWDWSLMPVKDGDDRVTALIMVLANVTDRKKAQFALIESERRFRAAFNQTFQHIGLLDPNGVVLLVNQTALDFTGLTQEAVVGKPLWQAPWWDDPAEATVSLQKAAAQAASGTVARAENRIYSASGEQAVMDITLKPLLDEHRNTILLIYEARDITEHIRAQEALQRSEEAITSMYNAERSARQLAEALRSAGLELSGSLDSDTVLESLLNHLHHVVPYTSAHILRLADQDSLTVSAARGEEAWDEPCRLLGRRYEFAELPLLQPLLEDRQCVVVEDTLELEGPGCAPNSRHARSWLGIPLQAGSGVIGVCALEHTERGFFTEELVHNAIALTTQASIAIQNAWLFEQVRGNRERLQALSRRLVEVQESERHYVARELHDVTGQALASLMVGLRMLARDSGEQPQVVARCEELKGIADGVLEDLHRLAIDLRPTSLDHLGLVAALRQHAEMISNKHDLTLQFSSVGKLERLPGEMETAVYRIVQEALTNIVRHARATRVDILLERRVDSLVVVVEDNGIGFDPQMPAVNQLGLVGMRERTDMLGGHINIESSAGSGTIIFLEVPCPSESSL